MWIMIVQFDFQISWQEIQLYVMNIWVFVCVRAWSEMLQLECYSHKFRHLLLKVTNWNMMTEMKIVLFRDMKLCSLLEVHWYFRGSTLMMEAAGFSEMLVCFYHITWHHTPVSYSLPWEHQISDDEKYSDT